MKYIYLIFLIIGWIWLLLWQVLYPKIDCFLSIIFFAPILGFIATSILESAAMRRQATIAMYLRPQGWLYRLLSGGIFMVICQMVKATLLTIFLIIEVIFFDSWIWVLLFIDLFIIWFFHYVLTKKLNSQIKNEYAPIFASEYLIVVNSILLSLVISIVGIYMSYPDYRKLTWLQAIEYEVTQLQGNCQLILVMARISAVKNAISWWLAETWLTKISDSYLYFSVWFIFLFNSTVFVWAYTRMLLGILTSFLEKSSSPE